MSSPSPSAPIFGFVFVLFGGGIILDTDLVWLGTLTMAIGGWLTVGAPRRRQLTGSVS